MWRHYVAAALCACQRCLVLLWDAKHGIERLCLTYNDRCHGCCYVKLLQGLCKASQHNSKRQHRHSKLISFSNCPAHCARRFDTAAPTAVLPSLSNSSSRSILAACIRLPQCCRAQFAAGIIAADKADHHQMHRLEPARPPPCTAQHSNITHT